MKASKTKFKDSPPGLIYNLEESALFYSVAPKEKAADNVDKHECVIMADKSRLTFVSTTTADETHKLLSILLVSRDLQINNPTICLLVSRQVEKWLLATYFYVHFSLSKLDR